MISINWATKVIFVPQADLTNLGGNVYELNINTFRLTLKDLEDDEAGMPFLRTHNHNTEVTVGGTILARVIEIINGYTVTFENGQYAVNLVGANSNIADVTNVNQVSIRTQNSSGLVVSENSINPIDENIEGPLTMKDVLRLMLSIQTGKTSITSLGGGLATVTFRDWADTKNRVVASMDGSERTDVEIDPT